MYRVIDGCLLERYETGDHVVSVKRLGRHYEAWVSPEWAWREVATNSPVVEPAPRPWSQADEDERKKRDKERSIRRARAAVRQRIKAQDLCSLLTLTYRENMTDLARAKRDFDRFMKRFRYWWSQLFPGRACVAYVKVIEPQKRGAWHVHIALPRMAARAWYKGALVKTFDMLRALWRGIVGQGNIDVSRQRRIRGSASKLWAYLQKYMGKAFGSIAQAGDAYSSNVGRVGESYRWRVSGLEPWQLVDLVRGLMCVELSDESNEYDQACIHGGLWVTLSPKPPNAG